MENLIDRIGRWIDWLNLNLGGLGLTNTFHEDLETYFYDLN